MYKFSYHLYNPRLVLAKRSLGDGSCSALVVVRAPHRRYASQDPSCKAGPAKPKSNKLFWGTIGATVLTGAAVVYAKNSPDARNWLETNVPLANDLIALVYQENTTYWKFTTNQMKKLQRAITDFMFGKEGVSPMDFPQQSEQDLDKDAEKHFARKDYELPPPKFEPLYVEEKTIGTPEVVQEATVIQTDKCEPEKPPTVNITKDIVELEHDMHENTKIAIDNYKRATTLCENYNKALYKIVESSLYDLDKKSFTTLQGAMRERDSCNKTARDAAAKARIAIDTLDRMIKDGVQAPPETVTITQRYIKQFRADLANAEAAFKAEMEKSIISEKYWNKVEHARNEFKDALHALFPGIDINARRLEFKGDVDLLLLYTMKQVHYLQKEIAELQTIRELKINRAIECHDEKALIEAKAEDVIKREQLERNKQFQKQWLDAEAAAQRHMKEELKKLYELQQSVLQDALKRKEAEVLGKFQKASSEEVEKYRIEFKKELAAMAGKMAAIEQTLKSRANAEAEARRSQSIWTAAEALLAATRRPTKETNIDNELKALEKAGKEDKLVQTILKGIPDDVRKKGIATETALRDRFETLEKSASKVALVGREGAALPVYFLSWLQSKLLFQQLAEIPSDELNNYPTDFTRLDTFEIIHRAKHYMNCGDLGAALRYVNLLQGGPRAAAKPWLEAARAHLEVKQAAEAVMAHASVAGLLYL